MSNGISNMFEKGFEAVKGFGEKIGDARFKGGSRLSQEQIDDLTQEFYDDELARLMQISPEGDINDQARQAMAFAEEKVNSIKEDDLTLCGQLTKPRSLLTGLGIVASLMAGRQSQRAYDDYMKGRTYDPSQNPFLANGGGIQAFADGNKVEPIGQQKLSEMMIMNLKEKPTSTMIKLMTAIDSPEILAAFLGMNQGGGIQGFAKGTPEFPRMTGNIEGPGTGTSDSIPAMLSDGEHVLTKQEVTQIGGGDNDLGHQRLYSMRQDLRSKARSNGIGRM